METRMSFHSALVHRAQQRRDLLELLDDRKTLNGLDLRSGVRRPLFRELLADCLLTYKESEDQGRKHFERVKGWVIAESDYRSLSGAIKKLLASPDITRECKNVLKDERQGLKAKVDLYSWWKAQAKRLSPAEYDKEQLDRLVQSLFALWTLVRCNPRHTIVCILDILDGVAIKPPRKELWTEDSLIKRIQEDGGGKRTACVAVCLFSTEPTLHCFRPFYSILMWHDTSGNEWPLLVVPKAKKARAKGMLPLASLKTLLGTEGLTDFCARTRPVYDEKSLTKRLPDVLEDAEADRLLEAIGRVVFRSLPMGPKPASKSR